MRFLGWATAGGLTFDAKGDGTFGVRAQLSIAAGRVGARNIVGDLSGTAISAAAQYRWEGRPELSVSLEGPQLDARAFIPAGSSLGDIFDVVLHGPLMSPGDKPGAARGLGSAKPGWRGAQTDTSIRVSAGQLVTAARTYRDVAMEIELKGGRLRLPLLRVAGDEGFSLELEGEVDDAASRPKGSLRGVIGANSGAAIAPLAELLGIPEAFRPDARRARPMVPLRLAGSMAFGARTPTSADLVLDGETNGVAAKLNARLDGATGGWRSGAADVTAVIEGNDAQAIAALLAPGGPRAARATRARAAWWSGRPACPARAWCRSRRSRPAISRSISADALSSQKPATRPPATSTSRPPMAAASPRSPGCRRHCGWTACPSPARSTSPSTARRSCSTGWR